MNDTFTEIADKCQQSFEARHNARENALKQARLLTRCSAHAIRAVHRKENKLAQKLLGEAREITEQLKKDLKRYPSLYYSGYTQDAIKEYAEAQLTYHLIEDLPLPMPEQLGIEHATYLKGLAESIGELRRKCLDILRHGYSQDAERLLSLMDEIYSLLVTMDFPDAITHGLRRQTDQVRGIMERTRADLTLSLREERLQQSLRSLEKRLPPES